MKKITEKTVTMAAAALMTMSALRCSGKQAVQAVDLTAASFDEIQKKPGRGTDRIRWYAGRLGKLERKLGSHYGKNMV